MGGTKTILLVLGVIIGIGFVGVVISEGFKFFKTKIAKDKENG